MCVRRRGSYSDVLLREHECAHNPQSSLPGVHQPQTADVHHSLLGPVLPPHPEVRQTGRQSRMTAVCHYVCVICVCHYVCVICVCDYVRCIIYIYDCKLSLQPTEILIFIILFWYFTHRNDKIIYVRGKPIELPVILGPSVGSCLVFLLIAKCFFIIIIIIIIIICVCCLHALFLHL